MNNTDVVPMTRLVEHGSDTAESAALEDREDAVSSRRGQPDPEQSASLLSRLCFWWLNPLLARGYQQPLEERDLAELHPDDSAHTSGHRFAVAWEREEAHGRHSVPWALHSAFGRFFWLSALWKVVYDVLQFAPPFFIHQLIAFVELHHKSTRLASPSLLTNEEEEEGASSLATTGYGLLLCVGLFLAPLVQTVCLNQYFQRCYRSGMRVRAGVVVAIYNKSLRLSTGSRLRTTTGTIVNLMSRWRWGGVVANYSIACVGVCKSVCIFLSFASLFACTHGMRGLCSLSLSLCCVG
jgi:hypothetical protein